MAVGACRIGRWGDELTPLFYAADRGQAYTARRLLEGAANCRGVEVDREESARGTTPLLRAALQQFLEVVNVLLQHGADGDKADHFGNTPLHGAAEVGSVEVAEVLLESRANVNKPSMKKETPLHFAAYFGHPATARLLLQSRADTTSKDRGGRAALAYARRQGHEEVAMLLVQAEEGGARQ